jgi:hypothetical protein
VICDIEDVSRLNYCWERLDGLERVGLLQALAKVGELYTAELWMHTKTLKIQGSDESD